MPNVERFPASETFTMEEFRTNGLLWLVNTAVFHPRGLAISFVFDDDEKVIGWRVQGDGTEPWYFEKSEAIDASFLAAQEFLESCISKVVIDGT